MYHVHFGLSGPPFQFSPTPDAIYLGKEHREGLALLEWGMTNEPSGLTVLMGETGTGKTTLVFAVLARHYANVRAAYLGNPRLDFERMMLAAMEQLGIEATGRSKPEMLEALAGSLERLATGERIALLFDEAQELSDDTLEELRLLSNVDTAAERRLQILLVGQPELGERLSQPRARSLNGRIGARAVLNPLDSAQARAYVEHRVSLKGGNAESIFDARALTYLLAHSGGLPRRINVLCHNAMLLAYGEGRPRVDIAAAKEAVVAYENFFAASSRPPAEKWRSAALVSLRFAGPLIGLAALGVALGTVYVRSSDYGSASTPAVSSAASDQPRSLAVAAPPEPADPSLDSPTSGTPVLFSTAPSEASAVAKNAAPEPTAAPKQSQPPAPRRIRVRHRDTLSAIAERYLGSPYDVDRLMAANPQLRDADRIYPGEIIYLPATQQADARR
jgi:general secretion pathway protein A